MCPHFEVDSLHICPYIEDIRKGHTNMITRHQTIDTIRENANLREALSRATQIIEISSQDDEGTWHLHTFANEGAAVEFEAKGRKRGFATRRGA